MQQQLLTSIILSGAIGFLQLNFLQDTGSLSSQMDKTSKTQVAIALSLLDYFIYQLTASVLVGRLSSHYAALVTLVVTMVVVLPLTIISGMGYRKYLTVVNHHKEGKSQLSQLTPRESAFDVPGTIRVYIFDFDHTFIMGGYISNLSYADNQSGEFVIVADPDKRFDNPEMTEADVVRIMNDIYLKQATSVYVDAKNRLKYYLIYSDSAG
ncbi:hypothetical protein ACEVFU_04445 [Lacticaseibacillus paracasei]|uniref:hypothetical protein n=1 Tax=Lacticaseibacillus paracasei TaxID=1597 RepID=UPI0035C76B4D